jgi:hypothetical protein
MPEFILEGKEAPDFQSLDGFTQGYIEAMFFTDCEHGSVQEGEDDFSRVWNPETDSSLPGDVGFYDLDADTLVDIIADCTKYQADNAALLERAYELTADGLAYTPERAGHDFWLTRNGHGAGFWSRTFEGDATIGDELAATCGWRSKGGYGEVWTTLGDDGKVYVN